VLPTISDEMPDFHSRAVRLASRRSNYKKATRGNRKFYGRKTLRIPAKANSIPEGSRTGFRAGPEQQSERSDAGFLIVMLVLKARRSQMD
jgi:hypothetical protein